MNKLFSIIIVCLCFACLWSCREGNSTSGKGTQVKGVNPGETLFQSNCANCHKPDMDFVGPALKGTTQRWKDKALLYEYVRNAQAVIAKDDYAAALFKKWNQAAMLPFPNLTDADIDAILNYCDTYKPEPQ